jgi:TolA-binding protein
MINSPDPEHPSFLQRGWRQAPWRTTTQGTSLVMAAVVLVAVIGALYLAQASRTAAAGRRLQELEGQRQQLEQQNAQLRAEIASLRSVPSLIAKAQAQGYHAARSEEVEYLPVRGIMPPTPQPVETRVQAAQSAAAADADDETVTAYDETLESYLSNQLAGFREGLAAFWQSTFSDEPPAPSASPTPSATRIP